MKGRIWLLPSLQRPPEAALLTVGTLQGASQLNVAGDNLKNGPFKQSERSGAARHGTGAHRRIGRSPPGIYGHPDGTKG